MWKFEPPEKKDMETNTYSYGVSKVEEVIRNLRRDNDTLKQENQGQKETIQDYKSQLDVLKIELSQAN